MRSLEDLDGPTTSPYIPRRFVFDAFDISLLTKYSPENMCHELNVGAHLTWQSLPSYSISWRNGVSFFVDTCMVGCCKYTATPL